MIISYLGNYQFYNKLKWPNYKIENLRIYNVLMESLGHSAANLQFVPIEKISSGANAFIRKTRERMYINKFNMIEGGLNKKL